MIVKSFITLAQGVIE